VQSQRHEYLTPFEDKRLQLQLARGHRPDALQSSFQGDIMFSLFGPIGLPEMLIILAIVILIFGANRLPELGKGIGAGIKNFKSGMKDDDK
jgi:sec-independent protein translocase protein TatA